MNIPIEEIKFDEHGLAPAIVQDADTRQVLTLAYVNAESLKRTIETNETWFWSRSRSSLWHKGETSGHTQRVLDILVDCDRDALTKLIWAMCSTIFTRWLYRESVIGPKALIQVIFLIRVWTKY